MMPYFNKRYYIASLLVKRLIRKAAPGPPPEPHLQWNEGNTSLEKSGELARGN